MERPMRAALNRNRPFTAGLLSMLLLASPAVAQPAAPATATPALSPATAAAVDQRVAALKARLAITQAEEPAWDAFVQTMRDNAAATDALSSQRASGAATMTAVDNMHSYAAIARAYADNTQRLSDAFDRLYTSLSDPQKKAADTLFRQQAAEGEKPAPR
jgi:cytochrome c551/c552